MFVFRFLFILIFVCFDYAPCLSDFSANARREMGFCGTKEAYLNKLLEKQPGPQHCEPDTAKVLGTVLGFYPLRPCILKSP